MAIVFQNRGLMPLDAVRLMGVSVKPSTGSPVGFFGTGLKYAIAVLLREGCQIDMWLGRRRYSFGSYDIDFRGEKLKQVSMLEWPEFPDETPVETDLAFTTSYGRTWEPWQAYRELYCNARDEPEGRSLRVEDELLQEQGPSAAGVEDDRTTIIVRGPAIEEAHRNRHTTILQTDPLVVLAGVEVHAGPSEHIFYQGIRVHKLNKRSQFTYNLTSRQHLTEDRTLAYAYDLGNKIGRALVKCVRPEIIEVVLGSKDDWFEGCIPYEGIKDELPSEVFMQVASEMRADGTLEGSARSLFRAYADHSSRYGFADPRLVEPTATQQVVFQAARSRVQSSYPEVMNHHFVFRDQSDSISTYDGVIRLPASLLNLGEERLAVAMLMALAQTHGGRPAEQLAHHCMTGEWISRDELKRRKDSSDGEEVVF